MTETEVSPVALSYNKLWKLLIDHKMKRTQLRKVAGISTNVIARMGKDERVSLESLEQICNALNCTIGDIVEVVADKRENTKTDTVD
jgi:DNA (cytosine-5)-methyltransferase 1